jgi:hypothetical protein
MGAADRASGSGGTDGADGREEERRGEKRSGEERRGENTYKGSSTGGRV